MPPETIAGMKAQPWWPGLEALAPTLPYDGLACRDHLQGKPLPLDWGTRLTMPVLVLDGGDSPASLRDPVAALAGLLPHVERHTFEGQGHGAPVEMVAPVLERFFRS